ncbi:hypothetical protein WN51_01113 [Melipona quadrifasciata]|uniref:Uncharacterized protein n=1 Tax=Melipona quadrifasciata TaxID=166423 RepID=A0A0N0U4J4_9HYME|nr:hypothetical protein WN51_01113 [Melipona quadrifasciata]
MGLAGIDVQPRHLPLDVQEDLHSWAERGRDPGGSQEPPSFGLREGGRGEASLRIEWEIDGLRPVGRAVSRSVSPLLHPLKPLASASIATTLHTACSSPHTEPDDPTTGRTAWCVRAYTPAASLVLPLAERLEAESQADSLHANFEVEQKTRGADRNTAWLDNRWDPPAVKGGGELLCPRHSLTRFSLPRSTVAHRIFRMGHDRTSRRCPGGFSPRGGNAVLDGATSDGVSSSLSRAAQLGSRAKLRADGLG